MEMARAPRVVQRLITTHEEKQWTSSRSMTPPPRYSRSSRTHSSSRECQPGEAQPEPVLQGVLDCLTSIAGQMWRMSEGSGKNGGPDGSIGLAQRPTTASTPSPIDATRSGSGGGSKGKGTRKNAYTVPCKEATRLGRVPAPVATLPEFVGAIRPSIQPRIMDSRASLHRREARTRFPESAVGNRISRPGQREDMSIHRVMILPDLRLTGASRL
jgi:hypothetical protein